MKLVTFMFASVNLLENSGKGTTFDKTYNFYVCLCFFSSGVGKNEIIFLSFSSCESKNKTNIEQRC